MKKKHLLVLIILIAVALFALASCAAEKQDAPITLGCLIELIESSGYTYKIPEGYAIAPMLSVGYTLISINGDEYNVSVFEYGSPELMEADMKSIQPDGFTIRNSHYSWSNPPQFYQKGRLILIYAGKNKKTMRFLDKHFGDVFAGMGTDEKLKVLREWEKLRWTRALFGNIGAHLQ